MFLVLRDWETASAVFFAYTAPVAYAMPGLLPRARRRALAGSVAGIALTSASAVIPNAFLLHAWVAPPALLLLGYWTSGLLFTAPMPRAERVLEKIDAALGVPTTSSMLPRAMTEILEFSYAAVYALVPLALALHLRFATSPDPDRFWTVVLVIDYVCFAALPWIRTRPPRALERGEPWRSSLRAFNLRLLGATSIQANTFPSGHAAEGLAVALLVADAPAPIAAVMFVAAAAVSAGAVYGRYHYAADAIAGWIVAISIWMAFK